VVGASDSSVALRGVQGNHGRAAGSGAVRALRERGD
jgi:hypothetical protein